METYGHFHDLIALQVKGVVYLLISMATYLVHLSFHPRLSLFQNDEEIIMCGRLTW